MKTSQSKIESTRRWVSQNKERVRASEREYYHKNPKLMKELREKYYAKHKEKHLKRCWEQRQSLKREVLQKYSPKLECKKCKFNDLDCLEIDHIKNDGSLHRKQNIVGPRILYWLKKNNYPKGFQVLCKNCNWKKHILSIKKYNK